VALVQPYRVRRFAQSQGYLAKTDKIDCRVIAEYCAKTETLRLYTPPSAGHQAFRALVDRRDQLVEDRKREANRLEGCLDADMSRDIKQSLRRLDRAIARQDAKIAAAISADDDLRARDRRLQQEIGIGAQTSACLLAHLPELGNANRQQIAALAGLAPYNNDSGTKAGQRSLYGGRARVRRAMYMAALVAVRWNDRLKAIYNGLLYRGKEKKPALLACARKLLVHLNSIVARDVLAPNA
jgi:transposase